MLQPAPVSKARRLVPTTSSLLGEKVVTHWVNAKGDKAKYWEGDLSSTQPTVEIVKALKLEAISMRDTIAKEHYKTRYNQRKTAMWTDWTQNHGKAAYRWARNYYRPPTLILKDPATNQCTGQPARILEIFKNTWSQ